MAIVKDSKFQILTELDRILAQQRQPGSKVATKEEEAQLVKNKEIGIFITWYADLGL